RVGVAHSKPFRLYHTCATCFNLLARYTQETLRMNMTQLDAALMLAAVLTNFSWLWFVKEMWFDHECVHARLDRNARPGSRTGHLSRRNGHPTRKHGRLESPTGPFTGRINALCRETPMDVQ